MLMANDRLQFKKAWTKRQRLYEEGIFGLPVHEGFGAILVSTYATGGKDSAEKRRQRLAFTEDAERVAKKLKTTGLVTEIIEATKRNIERTIKNPEITSVITIGHGTLSGLYDNRGTLYNWSHVSADATHLKRGMFFQRQCGVTLANLPVPLGLMAVTDPAHVIAATGEGLPDVLTPEHEALFQPVFSTAGVTYEIIKSLAIGRPRVNADSS